LLPVLCGGGCGELEQFVNQVARQSLSNPPERALRTPRSFARRDAQAVMPNELMTLEFDLIPTATLFRDGHQIRLSLAGHDADTFAAYGETGQEFRIWRTGFSRLELLVIVLDGQ
jgi:predicted acyl esterase